MTGPSLLPPLRRRWWLLAAAAVVAALVALPLAARAPKTYEAQAKLLVGPVSGDYPTLQASGALGRTYAELATSRSVVLPAARAAGIRLTRKEAEEAVSATSNDITRLVEIRARRPTAASAARFADAVATQLVALRRRAPASPTAAVLGDPRLDELSATEKRSVGEAVERAVGGTNPGALQVVERATPPEDPAAPRVALIVLLAALAGALAAAAYVIVREGGAPEDEPEAEFDLARFLEEPRDGEPAADLEVERWLGRTVRRERA
jgi:Chain length determinant protein